MALYHNEEEEYGGTLVIDETVFRVDWNDKWIIAHQYPNMEEAIQDRLFNYSTETGHYELQETQDTIYLSKEDSVYQKNGKWYHISNGWSPPDSLFPNRRYINYHIIDLTSDRRITMKTNSSEEFAMLRDSLRIPMKLDEHIIFEDLK